MKFNKIVGFRSGKLWKKIIAVIYYIFLLNITLVVINSFEDSINMKIIDKVIHAVESIFYLLTFVTPVFFFYLEDKFKCKKQVFYLAMLVSTFVMFFMWGGVQSLCSYDYHELVVDKEVQKQTKAQKLIENEQEKNKMSEMEIITRNGHPTFYGSIKAAHDIWNDVEDGKVIITDKYSVNLKNNTLLFLQEYDYKDDDLIRDIQIYFSRFKYPPNLYIDDVLPIVVEYLPLDLISQWYVFDESYYLFDVDGKVATDYVISYTLNNRGKEAYQSDEIAYGYTIDVIITVGNDGIVDTLRIHSGIPKSMQSQFLKLNGYKKFDWEFNLEDYK